MFTIPLPFCAFLYLIFCHHTLGIEATQAGGKCCVTAGRGDIAGGKRWRRELSWLWRIYMISLNLVNIDNLLSAYLHEAAAAAENEE